MRAAFRASWTLVALSLLSSCSGCQKGGSEPRRLVAKDAEAVLEIRDLGILVRTRTKVLASFGQLVSSQQVSGLQGELELRLGFDPSTAEGLAAAGLPKEGSIAVELKDGGSSSLWIVPVADAAKFATTLEKVVRARAAVDSVTKEQAEGRELTLFQSAFGPDKVTVATSVIHGGMGLVGLGSQGKAMVLAALGRASGDSIEANPEYQAQLKALGPSWEVRLISPSGAQALQGALRTASRVLPVRGLDQHPDLQRLISAGWSLDFSGLSAKVQGRLRLDPAGLEKSKALFATKGAPSPGVLAVDLPRAVILAQVAGSIPGLLELIAPAGSPGRAQLDGLFARMKTELSTDVEKEVLPLLTGRGAVALGLGDLKGRSVEGIMQNPLALLWSTAAIGVEDPAALLAVEKRLDPGLASHGLQISGRDAGGTQVRSVTQAGANGEQVVLVESFAGNKAMILANEPQITDQIVKNRAGQDHLAGQPGVAVELRFSELSRVLNTLELSSAPILFRSMIAKAIEALSALDTLSTRVHPTEDGIGVEATLSAKAGSAP